MEAGDNGALTSSEVEVMAKPVRRRFTAEYKLGVLREVEGCKGRGELGALLRREGLYSSHLTQWRKQRERGERQGLSRKRGPSPKQRHPLTDKVKVLERENARLKLRAERAEGLVELQKKVSEILGIELKQSAEKD
jgi:transposase-like protein